MKRVGLSIIFLIGALASACGDDDDGASKDATTITQVDGSNGNPDALPDGGTPDEDSGTPPADTGLPPEDSGMNPDEDGGGGNPDAEPDGGMTMPLTEEMEAGAFVQVVEARINVGDGTGTDPNVDTYASVTAKLGAGTRSAAMNTRSYEWSLSGGVELTIWFGNTNLDGDDEPPANVDGTDEVLWIAVSGTYGGKTSRDIGIGSTRAQVEAFMPTGYGPPALTTDLTNPPGVLASYFTSGLLVAYDANNNVRTVTIARAYNTEPNADIKIDEARLDFSTGAIDAFHMLQPGTRKGNVELALGYADGAGEANGFTVWSYAFIGVELFFFGQQESVLFFTVHEPYFGGLNNSAIGIGSPRADVEAELGMGMGDASMQNANLICYPNSMMPEVLVSYTNGEASTITMGFITCP